MAESQTQFDPKSDTIELLVLSACQTAKGKDGGMAGIAVGEGVKSALGSLWPVDGRVTHVLMQNFYQNLKSCDRGMTKAKAWQEAVIQFLKDPQLEGDPRRWTSPYYWASFTIVGDPV